MKEGYLLKRKTEHGVVSPQELEKINQYTRREFQAQELYTFSVVLCDNQVDRDFECFTKAANHSRFPLGRHRHKGPFIRVVGIVQHSAAQSLSAQNGQKSGFYYRAGFRHQKGGQRRLCGEPSALLHLRRGPEEGSLPPSEGENLRRQAKMYTPTDTEEGTRTSSDIIKAFSEGKEMTLSPEECAEISGCLRELAKKAEAGEDYERELRQEVVRFSLLSQPGVPKDIMERVAKRMTLEELKAFQKAYRQESGKLAPPKPQLAGARAEGAPIENAEFKI